MPYLVGMLVGIGVFRASGAMDFIIDGLRFVFDFVLPDTTFVDALPTAFMKPLSGSGAKAMMLDTMAQYGADSFVGRLSCMFQGAADTTFYIIALYFGSVGIKRTRYAVTAGSSTFFATRESKRPASKAMESVRNTVDVTDILHHPLSINIIFA
jgi:spore maturation protein SpmB